MVEQVNVHIKNVSGDGAAFEAFREHSDGTQEPIVTIPVNVEETILLPEPGVLLKINHSTKEDINTCWYNVTNNDHLVSWDAMGNHWEVQIKDNEDDSEVPTDVNVEVSGDPP